MHVDRIVLREAERMRGWLRGGKAQRKMLHVVSQSWKFEFASKIKLCCSLEVMTLFIVIIIEGSNETTWLILIPLSWADWKIFFSSFKTAVVSSLPDHTLSHILFSLFVYFSLIISLPLSPSLSPLLLPLLPCLPFFSPSLSFFLTPFPHLLARSPVLLIFFFFFWLENTDLSPMSVLNQDSDSVAHMCITDLKQCSEGKDYYLFGASLHVRLE